MKFTYACLGFLSLALALPPTALATPHFDGFIEAQFDPIDNVLQIHIRVIGGSPGTCVPGLAFENLTTGFSEPYLTYCCDEEFSADGTFAVDLGTGVGKGFIENDGDLDALTLTCGAPIDIQFGVWREDGTGGFVREALPTAVEAITWGQIKAVYQGE